MLTSETELEINEGVVDFVSYQIAKEIRKIAIAENTQVLLVPILNGAKTLFLKVNTILKEILPDIEIKSVEVTMKAYDDKKELEELEMSADNLIKYYLHLQKETDKIIKVVIIDDVVDTGRTIDTLVKNSCGTLTLKQPDIRTLSIVGKPSGLSKLKANHLFPKTYILVDDNIWVKFPWE